MKTIKDVAEQSGVSKTSIYNLLKKHSIETFKREGKTYIDELAESLILTYYNTEKQESIDDLSEIKEDTETFQSDFQPERKVENSHLLTILEAQLAEKDKTIQSLLKANQALIQAITIDKYKENTQLITGEATETQAGEASTTTKKKGFISRFFKGKL